MSIKEHLNRLIPRTKRIRASLLASAYFGNGACLRCDCFLHVCRPRESFWWADYECVHCNCSGNYALPSAPVGGTFMYQPGATIVYQYGMITSHGVWILGTYTGQSCVDGLPEEVCGCDVPNDLHGRHFNVANFLFFSRTLVSSTSVLFDVSFLRVLSSTEE